MDKVSRRREQVKILVDEGKSNQEIAEELNIKIWTVSRDIAALEKEGRIERKIERKKNTKVIKRREQVRQLVGKEKSNREIAEELGIRKETVARDIYILREEGKISKERRNYGIKKNPEVTKRREQVRQLVSKGKSNQEIAEELGISKERVENDIFILRKKGKISKERRNYGIKKDSEVTKRREQVMELANEGKSNQEIAKELGIKKWMIEKDIVNLRKEGKISKERRNYGIKKDPEVTKRREKVRYLVSEGKSNQEIAEELGVNKGVIVRDIVILRKEGKISKERRSQGRKKDHKVIERREKVRHLVSKGKSNQEIAEELGISKERVENDIFILRKKGKISKERRNYGIKKDSEVTKRREQVMELAKEGKSNQEIAKELGINKEAVARDICILRKKGKISKERRNNRIKKDPEVTKRREKVKQLVSEGKSNQEIAEELEVSKEVVAGDIYILKKEGKISKERRKKDQEVTKRREQVMELANEGKSNQEIAEELEVSKEVVAGDICTLRKEGKISKERRSQGRKKDPKVTERREQVIQLVVSEGKSNQEIAEELGVNKGVIVTDITILRKERKIPKNQERKKAPEVIKRREQVMELVNEGKNNQEIAEELGIKKETVARDIYILREEGKISKERQSKESRKRQSKTRFEKIINYIKSNKGEIQQAIDYAKSYEDSKYLTEKERNKLKAFIIQAEKIQEKNILLFCKKGKTIEEITRITKYSEGMIERVYRSYQKEQEIEENENEL